MHLINSFAIILEGLVFDPSAFILQAPHEKFKTSWESIGVWTFEFLQELGQLVHAYSPHAPDSISDKGHVGLKDLVLGLRVNLVQEGKHARDHLLFDFE